MPFTSSCIDLCEGVDSSRKKWPVPSTNTYLNGYSFPTENPFWNSESQRDFVTLSQVTESSKSKGSSDGPGMKNGGDKGSNTQDSKNTKKGKGGGSGNSNTGIICPKCGDPTQHVTAVSKC